MKKTLANIDMLINANNRRIADMSDMMIRNHALVEELKRQNGELEAIKRVAKQEQEANDGE